MKLTKNHLKLIVKECLIEILEEGVGQSKDRLAESRQPRKTKKRENTSNARSRVLDNISTNTQEKKIKNSNFEKNVEKVATQMTSDPVLSSILADTARTTLQEQVEQSGPGGSAIPTAASGDAAARAAASSNPEDLFSGASANWATLAFSDSSEK